MLLLLGLVLPLYECKIDQCLKQTTDLIQFHRDQLLLLVLLYLLLLLLNLLLELHNLRLDSNTYAGGCSYS